MARNTVKATLREEPPVEPKRTITLELPYQHAVTLRAVCRSIGGDPKGRRGHMDDISEALERFNLPYRTIEPKMNGSVHFPDKV